MKHTYTFQFVCCLLFAFLVNTQQATSQVTGSSLPAYQQSQSNWCWTTCGQMIYWAYKPGSITQCQFVKKSRDNENSNWFDCNNLPNNTNDPCANPGAFNYPQSLYTCGGSIENTLDSYGISSTGYGNALSGSTLTSYLGARKLTIARWGWNSGGGHVVVINRYKSGNVYFNNPSTGSAHIWSLSTFTSANGQGSWTHSLRMDNASVYGSALNREKSPSTLNEEMNTEVSMNLYPNPATGKFNILLNGNYASNNHLIITDAVGKTVYSEAIADNLSAVSMDVSAWSKGMYFVRLQSNPESVKQLIVQ